MTSSSLIWPSVRIQDADELCGTRTGYSEYEAEATLALSLNKAVRVECLSAESVQYR